MARAPPMSSPTRTACCSRSPPPHSRNSFRRSPELAAPFLYAIGRTLISRIRADNKRYRDSIAFARTGHR
jgi:hypothetical protein